MHLKLLILGVILILVSPLMLNADKKDFQFQPMTHYFRYKEEFFRLYNQWLYADQDSMSRNIYFLELAYAVPFDDPIKALVVITNEIQYLKYQNLLMMHICRLLTQAYIDYGYYFMKENIYFFNHEYIQIYLDGYEIAEFYFSQARKYWELALKYAQNADAIKGFHINFNPYIYHLDLENELYLIKVGELNYFKVIAHLMSRIENNRKIINQLLEK